MNETSIELFDECDSRAYKLMEMALNAVEGKQFKQRPRVAWHYPLDEDGIQYIELRPEYITTEKDKCRFDALHMDMEYASLSDSNFQYTGNISLDVGIEQDGEVRRSGGIFKLTENYGGIELRYNKRSGQQKYYSGPSEKYADLFKADEDKLIEWDAEMDAVAPGIATAVKMVIEEPEKLTALESSHCCYCGKGLLDTESVSRGYGPDCAKQNSLPYVQTPTKWKDKRPEPTIIESVGILTSLADAVMAPTEMKIYSYATDGRSVTTKMRDSALLYQGSTISKYRRKVTVITYSSGGFRFKEVNLVKLTVEKYAQYERALRIQYVNKRERNQYIQTETPNFNDHSINPFCFIVDGWGHRARRNRKTKELVSGFPIPPAPSIPEDTTPFDTVRVEARLHMQAFIEPWDEYVRNNNVKEIVRLFPEANRIGLT